MIFMVLTFGTPVMDPHGNNALKISVSEAFVFAWTVEVIWNSVGYFSIVNNSGTVTVPISAMRPMSLRIISTIITFSAWFFGEFCSQAACALSSISVRPRLAVPFMGLLMM